MPWEVGEGGTMQFNHTFVVCAYKESEYLEQCVLSLKSQSVSSQIMIVTSTPNAMIEGIARKHDLPLIVNEGEGGITQDWNFGLRQVKTRYATIAHQDDIYEPCYAEDLVKRMEESRHPLIAFSDYDELRNGRKVHRTLNLLIKRMMLFPLRFKCFRGSRFVRRRVLAFGDPICCPAVAFCMDHLTQPIFRDGFRSCEDWEAWENLSRLRGDFIYVSKALMCHRIHSDSATTAVLHDNARIQENYIMYCKFWPKWVAKLINRLYTASEKSNELQ